MQLRRFSLLSSLRLTDSSRRHTRFLIVAFTAFAVAVLVQPYDNEQPYSGQESSESRDNLTLDERLGYATLLGAGYVEVTMGEKQHLAGFSPDISLRESAPDLGAIWTGLSSEAKGTVAVPVLAAAIVATERYGRSAIDRTIESVAARVALVLTGRLPDFSLGVAQIRPSTIRSLVEPHMGPMSDEALYDLLMDDYYNVLFAAKHIGALTREHAHSSLKATIVAVARDYNGARSFTNDGLRYANAVQGAYDLLLFPWKNSDFGESEDPSEADPATVREQAAGCLNFETASVHPHPPGIVWDGDGLEAIACMAEDAVLMVAEVSFSPEPGSASVLLRLRGAREDRVVENLYDLGIRRDRLALHHVPHEFSGEDAPCDSIGAVRFQIPVSFDCSWVGRARHSEDRLRIECYSWPDDIAEATCAAGGRY